MPDWFTIEALLALLTLTSLEVVLGIDNLVFLSILANKLPEAQRANARRIGLLLAMAGRIVLLFGLVWVIRLAHAEAFTLAILGWDHSVTWEDIILIVGGLFLLAKGTWEIHENLEGHAAGHEPETQPRASYASVLAQVLAMDLVFSVDSVITAVGMTEGMTGGMTGRMVVMVSAVVIAIIVMIAFASPLSRFIERHPTMKMLALAFLLLVGVALVADGSGIHIPRGYIYFAMGFSLAVELLNLKVIKRNRPGRPRTEPAEDHAE